MRLQELLSSVFESYTLLEYNREVTIQNYGSKVLPIARRDRSILSIDKNELSDEQLINVVLDRIEKSDPTKNKEYSQALTKIYAQGQTPFEDLGSTLADYLTKFHKLKQKKVIPSPRNDFMRYTSVGDFMSVVDEYPDVGEEQKDKGNSTEIYKDSEIRVVEPRDQTAACYYGRGTRWCTAANTNNMFNTYSKSGSLYIIIPQKPQHKDEKYQLHFESKQYMNELDRRVPLIDLVKRFPQLKKVFEEQAMNFDIKALLMDTVEYEKLLKAFPSVMEQRLKEFIANEAGVVIKSMLKELYRSEGDLLKDIADPDEFKELAWEAFNDDSNRLIGLIISKVPDIDTWTDQDALYDIISDCVADWTRRVDFYELIMDALESIGEDDAQMDCSYIMDGEIQSWISGAIEEITKELL